MTSRLTIHGEGSITLTRDELADLDLPGRGIFGPMTQKEVIASCAICEHILGLARKVGKHGVDVTRLCRETEAQIEALKDGVSPGFGPVAMRQILERLLGGLAEATKAAEKAV